MTYQSRRKPRVKQAEALAAIKSKKVFALLMKMRTGKTKVIVDHWGQLVDSGKVMNLLVVAPAGAYLTWPDAIQADLDPLIYLRAGIYVWDSATANTKRETVIREYFMDNFVGPRILIINSEALSVVDAARDLCLAFLEKGKCVAVIDESVCIKNRGAEITQFACLQIASRAEFRYILTGLITPRDPRDLFTQTFFLDYKILGFPHYDDFLKRHVKFRNIQVGAGGKRRGRTVKVVDKFLNVDELQAKLEPYSFKASLEDCYDLPPSQYVPRYVQWHPKQKKIYDELKEFATAELSKNKYVTVGQVIVQLNRLHQVLCGHSVTEQGEFHTVPEYRTRELMTLLDDVEGKAVIWCSYDHDIRKVVAAIEKEYGKGSTARFWGGNRSTREAEEKVFKASSECRFMVANPAAGKYARTWDMADTVIYYSTLNNLDHRAQSEERVRNVDKAISILYVDLIIKGTMDEKILKALRNKINLNQAVTGDNWREWIV